MSGHWLRRQSPVVCLRAHFLLRPLGLFGRTTNANQSDLQKTEPRRDTKHCFSFLKQKIRIITSTPEGSVSME